jgi:hypothetical protein
VEDEISGSCSTHRRGENPYIILTSKMEGKPEGCLGRPRHRWEHFILIKFYFRIGSCLEACKSSIKLPDFRKKGNILNR